MAEAETWNVEAGKLVLKILAEVETRKVMLEKLAFKNVGGSWNLKCRSWNSSLLKMLAEAETWKLKAGKVGRKKSSNNASLLFLKKI